MSLFELAMGSFCVVAAQADAPRSSGPTRACGLSICESNHVEDDARSSQRINPLRTGFSFPLALGTARPRLRQAVVADRRWSAPTAFIQLPNWRGWLSRGLAGVPLAGCCSRGQNGVDELADDIFRDARGLIALVFGLRARSGESRRIVSRCFFITPSSYSRS